MSAEGLDDELPPGRGWHKMRAFGHVVYASRSAGCLWLCMRVGNVPLGVPFSAQGSWAMIDVIEEPPSLNA